MPSFSTSSQDKLDTTHQDLQAVLNYAIRFIDFTVLYGIRTEAEQFDLYKKGRRLVGDAWVVEDHSQVVTYKDGFFKKSKHQAPYGEAVSRAVDIVFYHQDPPHIRWDDHKSNTYLAGIIMGVAKMLKAYDVIEHDIVWGDDWDSDNDLHDQSFMDVFHFQIK